MRKLSFVVFLLLVFGTAAMAQKKIDTKWHCPKQSADHKFDVGDIPDHSYMILQGSCDATSSGSGLAEKKGDYTEFREMWKESMNVHGRFNVTLDNGDKVYYTYEWSASTDITKPIKGHKWKVLSGTGKYKGIKGSGTCSGKIKGDEADWVCTGTYSIGK
jgi:hypothetical protein